MWGGKEISSRLKNSISWGEVTKCLKVYSKNERLVDDVKLSDIPIHQSIVGIYEVPIVSASVSRERTGGSMLKICTMWVKKRELQLIIVVLMMQE